MFLYAKSALSTPVAACLAADEETLADLLEDLDDERTADPAPVAPVTFDAHTQQLAEEHAVQFADGEHHIFTPALVVWGWLTQVFSPAKSCFAAVARIIVLRVAMGGTPCSANDGAYCKARSKLPESFLRGLALHVGTQAERAAPADWLWNGRRVLLADGLECSMPDTPSNQAQYPQSSSQKKGLGFPQIRLVVLLAFATACVVGCAMGPRQGKETGETALFRKLSDAIGIGDVVVADRYYCTYWHIALLQARGADSVLRLHARRKYDLDEDVYQSLPETLSMREVKVQIRCPGYRVRQMVVATTLLDAAKYPKSEIADLYHKRWHVELDIRSIKQTMKMDILSCKTPEMVRKEIWIHILGYNQIRKTMAESAQASQVLPRQLSFALAMQTWDAFRVLLTLSDEKQRVRFVELILVILSTREVGNRPGRREPRQVKRRPKPYGRLMVPRDQARARLTSNE